MDSDVTSRIRAIPWCHFACLAMSDEERSASGEWDFDGIDEVTLVRPPDLVGSPTFIDDGETSANGSWDDSYWDAIEPEDVTLCDLDLRYFIAEEHHDPWLDCVQIYSSDEANPLFDH